MMSQETNIKTKKSILKTVREALTPLQYILLLVCGTALLLTVFLLGIFGYWLFAEVPQTEKPTTANHQHEHGGDKAQIWSCSMHPQIQKNGPGKCPICAMDLIPVKARQCERQQG